MVCSRIALWPSNGVSLGGLACVFAASLSKGARLHHGYGLAAAENYT